MNPPTLREGVQFLLVGSDDSFVAGAQAAHALAFPGAPIKIVKTVGEAMSSDPPPSGAAVILLDAPSPAELTGARSAVDAQGLPRWAVVIRAVAPSDGTVTAIAPEDWNPRLIARCLQAASIQHELRREIARCRADFLTVGTRMAHDLRSPLGGILTTTEVLREILAEDAPERVPLTDGILESSEDLMKLIRQLSFLAKASAQITPPAPLNMSEAFFNALQSAEKQAVAKGVTVEYSRTWPEISGHAAWLELIWQNLLVNALKHAGPAPRVAAGWDETEGEFRFWVKDNGSVAPAKRAMLFHPFHLLHQTNAPRGFGLPLVQRLVELEGGRCGYEALPEGGSRFFFVLPRSTVTGGERSGLSSAS